jgi:hypothetical protein
MNNGILNNIKTLFKGFFMKYILLILTLLSGGISIGMDNNCDIISAFSKLPMEVFHMMVPTMDYEYNTNINEMTPFLVLEKYAHVRQFAQTCRAANFLVSDHYSCLSRCYQYSQQYFMKHNLQIARNAFLPFFLFTTNKKSNENLYEIPSGTKMKINKSSMLTIKR